MPGAFRVLFWEFAKHLVLDTTRSCRRSRYEKVGECCSISEVFGASDHSKAPGHSSHPLAPQTFCGSPTCFLCRVQIRVLILPSGWVTCAEKIVATAKEVGVLPPEAPQWPNSSSRVVPRQVPGVVPRHVPGVVPIMFRGMSGVCQRNLSRLHHQTPPKAGYRGGGTPT